MPLFAKSSDRFLGVDIGHDNLKVIEVEINRDQAVVTNAGIIPTPLHFVVEGQVVMPELVGQALRELIQLHGMTGRQCIGAVPGGGSVLVRPISVPRQKPSDLAQSIVFEAQKYVSTTPEESYFEAPILPEMAGAEAGSEMWVLLVVVPRSLVDGRVAAMEMAKLEPIAMDVNALAAVRNLLSVPQPMESDPGHASTVAFVDLGASYTEVTIVQGNVPVFTRTINIGGTSFTHALAGVLGSDFEEAERIKHNLDIEAADEASSDTTANRVIHSLLEELVRDIRRSLAYHASTLGMESIEGLVDQVILLGGGSQLIHTADYFANVLQMNVVIGEPPANGPLRLTDTMRQTMGPLLPSYLTALGLGMWPLYSVGK